ncbi:MAG: hypothetical protein ACQEWV_13015 [Bacillota bacterium]
MNTYGTSTPEGNKSETNAIKNTFCTHDVLFELFIFFLTKVCLFLRFLINNLVNSTLTS